MSVDEAESPGGVAICGYFTACEASVLATAVHTAAPILLGCAAARLTRAKTEEPADGSRSRVQLVLLALCVLCDGVAAALPLLAHIVPGMITLTGQVAAVSGVASWSAACALLLVLFSVEYSLDCTRAVVLWTMADTFAGALSIADAACGGIGAAGVLWRSAGAMLVLASVAVRLLLLLLLLFPRLGAGETAEDQIEAGLDDPTSDGASSGFIETARAGGGAVAWGPRGALPALGKALEQSGWLSQLLMMWPGRMLAAARVRPLFHGDMSEAPPETHPALALETFFLLWARPCWRPALANSSSSWRRLGSILWKMNRDSWGMVLAIRLVALLLRLAGLLMMRQLLVLGQNELLRSAAVSGQPESEGAVDGRAAPLGPDDLKILGNLGGMVVCLLVAAVLGVQGLLYARVEETKMRNLLWAVLYRTCVTQQVQSQRQCVQRFAAALDIDTTVRMISSALAVVEGGVELLVGAIVLHLLLPLWGSVAAAALIGATGLRLSLTLSGRLRPSKWLHMRECHAQRLAASEELLSGVLSLKYLGWEHAMAQRVLVMRRRERRALGSLLQLDSIERGLGEGAGLLSATLLSLGLLAAPLGPDSSSLSPAAPDGSSFLTGLAVLMLMWGATRSLPANAWALLRAWHALARLDSSLQPQHVSARVAILPPNPSKAPPQGAASGDGGGYARGVGGRLPEVDQAVQERQILVRLDDVTVAWQLNHAQTCSWPRVSVLDSLGGDGSRERPSRTWRVLENVKLFIRAGDRVAVVGGAGSGKSSLLMAILGEACALPANSTSSRVSARTSFVSRPIAFAEARPWVNEELSIGVNVIGWQKTDMRLLSQILDLCGLKPHGHSIIVHSSAGSLPSCELPIQGVLDGSGQPASWPDELRQRVGLARAVYAAALACASPCQGSQCLLLLDEPLRSVQPATARANQLQRILRSPLLLNAGIVMTCRDAALLEQSVSKVLLLRACRAIAVAPPTPSGTDFSQPHPLLPGPLSRGGAVAAIFPSAHAKGAPAQGTTADTQGHDTRGPTVWNVRGEHEDGEPAQEQHGLDDSYMLIEEIEHQQHRHSSDTDSGTDSAASRSTHTSPEHKRRAARSRQSDLTSMPAAPDGACASGFWAAWMMMDRRPHGAGGVCDCQRSAKALVELQASPSAHRPLESASSGDQAQMGCVLLNLLHGHRSSVKEGGNEQYDLVAATWAPACLVLLYGLGALACICAPWVLVLIWAGSPQHPDSPAEVAMSSSLDGASSKQTLSASVCPPWTPCSTNCSSRVAGDWEAVADHLASAERGSLVWLYVGLLASAGLTALLASVSAIASSAWPSVSPWSVFGRHASSLNSASRLGGAWGSGGGAGNLVDGGVLGEDLVSRLLLRATSCSCNLLVRTFIVDKIKCALSSVHIEGQLDGVAGAQLLSEPLAARQVLLSIVHHATCVIMSISCMLLVWPALALPVAVLVLWLTRLEAYVSSARMHLQSLWSVPACGRLDRLWVALRNGVEMRASCGAKEAEENALHQALCLEAAPAMTCVGAQLMVMLRIEVLGIALTSLPALLTVFARQTAAAQGPTNYAKVGTSPPSTTWMHSDAWLLVGAGMVQAVWCWAHCRALVHAWRALSQAIPSIWRLHTMSRPEILPNEGVYRARCPAAKASHKASDAILDALQKRGLSGTWRTFCASNSSRQASSSHADAGATRACAPHVTHDAQYSDSARSGDERQSHAMQHELEFDETQLADGLVALGGDGAFRSCNGFTEPLRARVLAGGLLWVEGAAVVREKGRGLSRYGLAAVLGGWAKAAAGRVLLAGDDLALLPLSEVRRQVVVVPREPLVVSGTVRQNLDLLGKAQGDWEIWAALEQCFFADTVRSWPGKLDCVVQAAGCGNLACAGTCVGGMAICACHDSQHALPCLPDDGQSGEAAGSSPNADVTAVYGLSLHQRQFIALTRAVLASALNGSRVLVVEGVDELVDQHTQRLLMTRQLAVGITTVLISGKDTRTPGPHPVLDLPGALAIFVQPDGSVRHCVGGTSRVVSEASDRDDYDQNGDKYTSHDAASDSNYDSDTRPLPGVLSPHGKKRSVAGQAGKALKDGLKGAKKGFGKAGRLIGRTAVAATSLVPIRSSASSVSSQGQ